MRLHALVTLGQMRLLISLTLSHVSLYLFLPVMKHSLSLPWIALAIEADTGVTALDGQSPKDKTPLFMSE